MGQSARAEPFFVRALRVREAGLGKDHPSVAGSLQNLALFSNLDVIAKELLEKEILFQADLERLIGKRPFDKPTTYQQYTNGQGKYEKKQQEQEQPGVDPTPTLEGEKPDKVGEPR